ncbi:uncharacterized protein LOC108193855 isoform X1 [Daucus carota subsp. sativus]|uniref:uncharacterized protein LOC108193855 isoform X1 n=1 Tax=Daucus carota subsp. sativus TaxID=79200 RepID=UPI0007EEFC47|nr:PREDICTED: uncharacterized protein LOC108193855 isoform X1 [Daucus carota subsp. sativus]XP_017216177.1 PREDICTED: uncharacterized protein LOC108193855 isoform X2 [Daucus carota subsp. sativus]
MAKRERDKSDGLEIISVGSLYSGPLDKKYWSSSRGKDRYPYPVGYHAMRTQNGVTYTMQIHEGLKGPSFTITSTDGQSCTGQTPDIAWKSCQKTSASHTKLGHGKRYSCKIDGVEFFGFKNQFVLRLFRELVANVNRKAASSNNCEGDLETKHQTRCTEPCRKHDLVQYLEKPEVTGKRSRRCGVSAVKSIYGTRSNAVPAPELRSQKKNIQSQKNCSCSPSNDSHGVCNKLGTIDASKTSKTIDEQKDCLHLVYSSEHFNNEICKEDVSVFVSSHEHAAMTGSMFNEKEPFNRNKVISPPLLKSSEKVEKEETLFRNASQTINDLYLCAPHSLDVELDGTLNSKGVNDLAAACLITPDDSKTQSCLGEETVTSTENVCSEKSGTDSVGQEITTSMMTVLLPRALPLLKKDTRKKKTTLNTSGISVYKKRSKYKSSKTNLVPEVTSVALITEDADGEKQREEENISSTDLGSMKPPFADIGPMVLDNYDNNQSEMNVDNQYLTEPPSGDIAPMVPDSYDNNQSERDHSLLVSTAVQEDLVSSGRNYSAPKTTKLPVTVNMLQESTVGATLHFSHKEHQPLSERLQFHRKKKLTKEPAIPCQQKSVKTFSGAIEETVCTTDAEINPLESLVKEINDEKARDHTNKEIFGEVLGVGDLAAERDIPLSESIICRSLKDTGALEARATGSIATSDNFQQNLSYNLSKHDSKYEEKNDGQWSKKNRDRNFMLAEAPGRHIYKVTPPTKTQNSYRPAIFEWDSQDHDNKKSPQNQALPELDVSSPLLLDQGESFRNKLISRNIEETGSDLTAQTNMKHDSEGGNIFELMGCYIHPKPILSVLLSIKNDAICICVLCGSFVDKQQTLYIHKTPTQGQRKGCPSLIGHAPIVFPVTNDALCREIALDGSSLQFTPDGQYLVLLDCIKAPYCRRANISCPCPECTSASNKKNAVKIVQVKPGYMSVVATLKTANTIHCILVCEPNYLLAAEESKKLHLWVMNSTWSKEITERYFPISDCMDPYIMELKRIPKCSTLILGHNGFGKFSLWDIEKCILVSRFSAASTSLCRFSPISALISRRQGIVAGLDEEQNNNIIDASTNLFLENASTHTCTLEGKDVLIPLLISNTDLHSHQSSDYEMNKLGWRQALLVNNEILLDDILDSSAVAVGTVAGHGIIGTMDGLVYMWELSTGATLGNLHQFKGSAVSCIATDGSSSGAFAVAADCWLRVYLHS